MFNKQFYISLVIVFFSFLSLGVSAEPIHPHEYNLMVITDIHLGSEHPANLEPTNEDESNDLDLETFKKLLNKIGDLILTQHLSPNLSIVLGDLVDHQSSNPKIGSINSRETQLQNSFNNLFQLSQKISLPMTYVYGNNDSLIGNYQNFYSDKESLTHSPYEIAKNSHWKHGFLSQGFICDSNSADYPCIENENRQHGYYTEKLANSLKLIVLNSVLFNNRVSCSESCSAEIEWLHSQLQIAYERHESVLIAMHIPPGIDSYKAQPFWNLETQRLFLETLRPYAENLMGILTAHTHMEEMQMINFPSLAPIPIIYTPGLSTSHGNLPAFKYVTLVENKTGKWEIKNYKTYHYLADQFKSLYDFNSLYCTNHPEGVISACLDQVLKNNELDDFFAKMNNNYTVGNPFFSLFMNVNSTELVIQE